MKPRKINERSKQRREEILKYFYQYELTNRYPPTIREVQIKAEISSLSVTNYYLDQLTISGLLDRRAKISRGTSLTEKGRETAMTLLGIRIPKKNRCPHCGGILDERYHWIIAPPKQSRPATHLPMAG